MKITSLFQLDHGDFPICHQLSLTPETMAMLTDFHQSQLEGFFGAPSSVVGDLILYYEEDMNWGDLSDPHEEAIIPIQWMGRREFMVTPIADIAAQGITLVLDAFAELKYRHHWNDWDFHDEDGIAFKTLDRYAQRHGYMANLHSMIGTSRGDELLILHITKLDRLYETTNLYCEVAPYWEGNRFAIQVILNSPFTDRPAFNETLGWVVGRDRYVLDTAVEILNDAITTITRKDQ